MNFKNIYLIRASGILLILGSIFLAVVLNNTEFNITLMKYFYILVGIYSCALGYFEIADMVKLGYGITRFSIYQKFTLAIIRVDGLMLGISFLFVFLTKLSDSSISLVYFFDYRMIIYFTLVIYFLGQLGMFLGNIKLQYYLKSIFLVIILALIISFINMGNKFILNTVLIIVSIGLSITNYYLIRNIKLEIKM